MARKMKPKPIRNSSKNNIFSDMFLPRPPKRAGRNDGMVFRSQSPQSRPRARHKKRRKYKERPSKNQKKFERRKKEKLKGSYTPKGQRPGEFLFIYIYIIMIVSLKI